MANIGKNDSALNKNNLMMSGDPFGLSHGYADADKTPVREHLLGVPWTRLVNEGYLVDLRGQGFYTVTEEGKEYLTRETLQARPSPNAHNLPKATTGIPRAFLSYSWEGSEHQQWVVKLAERLRADGVDIILDRWYLNPGDDKLHFMEKSVGESNFVVLVCTPTYAERANDRVGGVGYESTVITAELAKQILQNKFIPVMRKGTWDSSLPLYIGSRMGVNLMDEPYDEEYERLLRGLHGEPIQPPPLAAEQRGWTSGLGAVVPRSFPASRRRGRSDEQAHSMVY